MKNRQTGEENHVHAFGDHVGVTSSGLVALDMSLDPMAYEDGQKLPLKIFSVGSAPAFEISAIYSGPGLFKKNVWRKIPTKLLRTSYIGY